MTRVTQDTETKRLPSRKIASRYSLPPSMDDLKRALLGLRSFTDEVQQIQQTQVPDDYDISMLTAQFSRLSLKTTQADTDAK